MASIIHPDEGPVVDSEWNDLIRIGPREAEGSELEAEDRQYGESEGTRPG
jgi:hypothetical protein